jgi:drug/metabolite transporter (DMT)-like permease
MPRRKNGQNNLSKIFPKKRSFEDLPLKTMKVTVYALRWIFLLIFLYIISTILILTIQGGTESVVNIVTWSVTGFFTFFMGYFGWILAQGMIEMITGDKEKIERNLSYYLSRKKRHRF